MNDVESKLRREHGESVIYEDRGEIDMECTYVDLQPCSAVDHTLMPYCEEPGIYRVFGQHRPPHKGARFSKFDRHLCAKHLAAWATLHGTTVEKLLSVKEEMEP